MGNAQSQKKNTEKTDMFFNEELINSIDLLASKLIFEQSFQQLLKLNDPLYCDEVSVLTHRLLKKKLKPINVNIVSTRVKYGNQDMYAITDEGFKELKVVDDLGEKNYDKNEMCLNISKFYTRIFQAYSAIVKAINPVYMYNDIDKTPHIRSVFELDNVSEEHKKRSKIGLRSLCSKRLFYLKPIKMGEHEMTLKMDYCDMNAKDKPLPILNREHVEHRDKKKIEEDEEGIEKDESKEVEKEEGEVEKDESKEVEKEEEEVEKDEGEEVEKDEGEVEKDEGEVEKDESKEVEKEEDKKKKEEGVEKEVEGVQKGGENENKDDNEDKGSEDTERDEEIEREGEEETVENKDDNEDKGREDTEQGEEREGEDVDNEIKAVENKDDSEDEGKVKMASDVIEMMNLGDEPGIASLESLYKDVMKIVEDVDEKGNRVLKGVFDRSDKSNKKYKQDLKDFYKAFVPNGKNVDSIEEFRDIKLRDFTKDNNGKLCSGKTLKGDSRKREDSVFIEYANHFQAMINHVQEREKELIELLHELFEFDLKKEIPIKIKGDLTEDKLNNEIMPRIIKTIKTMYIDCEKDFQRGVEIYNKIYEQRNNL